MERDKFVAKAVETTYQKLQDRKVFRFLSTDDPEYVKGVIEAALQDAYDQGAEEGYSLGHDEGYHEGYDSGYDDGAADQYND